MTDDDEQRQEHLRVYGPDFVKNLTDDQLAFEQRYARTGWWIDEVNAEAQRRAEPRNSPRDEQIQRLADAYKTEPTPEAIADAIISREQDQILHGEGERNSVVNVMDILVRDEGTLTAYLAGRRHLGDEMRSAAARHSPGLPPEILVEIVVTDVVVTVRAHES